ncbi:MAG: NAD(P)/FAD-dependent oxidoreductase [Candidatus Cloacimonetes bacterium]|nr:NAD(P)/FAD-dependent oxidoreductase [Candidatus Cloacimonadota bacterium]
MTRVAVIGGGPAGMMAACRAAECGADVTLLEKKNKLGLKLSLTGKGRCNITNTETEIMTFVEKYGENGKFLINTFNRFYNKDLMEFLQKHGLVLKELSGGRIYPDSDNSWDVVDVFVEYLKDLGVHIEYNSAAKELLHYQHAAGGVVHEKGTLLCDAIIIATGGKSYPQTGSSGDGYQFARVTGHKVTDLYPGLVPFNLQDIDPQLDGLKLKNVEVSVTNDDHLLASTFGEFFFTEWGADGSAILRLSSMVKEEVQEDYLTLHVDVKPALDEQKVHERILREIQNNGKLTYLRMLKELLPEQLVPYFILRTGIPEDIHIATINKQHRETIVRNLKNLTFTITGTRPMEEAIITSGGVALSEVDPGTMESKKIKNLYFAGEVLDIDGDTGGYNLQAAFSTGYIAGENAAKEQEHNEKN